MSTNLPTNQISRRRLILASVTASAIASMKASDVDASCKVVRSENTDYVPVNDYPYFDYEPTPDASISETVPCPSSSLP